MTKRSTAAERYSENRELCISFLDEIREGLDGHLECHRAEPGDWGFVGDVADIASKLKEIADRLWNRGEYGTSEVDSLEEMAQRLHDEAQAGSSGNEEDRSDWSVADWLAWLEEETEAATGC